MYVSILSKSDINDESKGKEVSVGVEDPKMEVLRTLSAHIDDPAWIVEVAAQNWLEYSSGARTLGESYKAVTRTLKLQLTPADVANLLRTLQESDLLELSLGVRPETNGR